MRDRREKRMGRSGLPKDQQRRDMDEQLTNDMPSGLGVQPREDEV